MMQAELREADSGLHPVLLGGVVVRVAQGTVLRLARPGAAEEGGLVRVLARGGSVAFECSRAALESVVDGGVLGAALRFEPGRSEVELGDVEPLLLGCVLEYIERRRGDRDAKLKCFTMSPEHSRGLDALAEALLVNEPNESTEMQGAGPDHVLVALHTAYGGELPDAACLDPALIALLKPSWVEGLDTGRQQFCTLAGDAAEVLKYLQFRYDWCHWHGLDHTKKIGDFGVVRVPRGRLFRVNEYDGSMSVELFRPREWLMG